MMMTLSGSVGERRDVVRALHDAGGLAVSAEDAGHVSVNVSLRAGSVDLAALLTAASPDPERTRLTGRAGATLFGKALRAAAEEFFTRVFAAEIGKIVEAYRLMLRESLAKADDAELQAALNRARLQEKILASTSMVDQAQACELLGLSGANPSATMKRKENKREILRFTMDGRAVYPLFQFDVEGRHLFPVIARLIAEKPKGWSDLRLLHWLTRPHLDMDGMPAEALGADGDAVLAAFGREIEPAVHG